VCLSSRALSKLKWMEMRHPSSCSYGISFNSRPRNYRRDKAGEKLLDVSRSRAARAATAKLAAAGEICPYADLSDQNLASRRAPFPHSRLRRCRARFKLQVTQVNQLFGRTRARLAIDHDSIETTLASEEQLS